MFNNKYLKDLRLEKGYTLAKLASETGYSASYISQIEKGLKVPSIATLRKFCEFLNVPLIYFFMDDVTETGIDNDSFPHGYEVIYKTDRKNIVLSELATKCEMITPQEYKFKHGNHLNGIIYTVSSGKWCSEKLIAHSTDEVTYILKGLLRAQINDKICYLEEGDSIYITALTLHNFQNCGMDDLVMLSFSSKD